MDKLLDNMETLEIDDETSAKCNEQEEDIYIEEDLLYANYDGYYKLENGVYTLNFGYEKNLVSVDNYTRYHLFILYIYISFP